MRDLHLTGKVLQQVDRMSLRCCCRLDDVSVALQQGILLDVNAELWIVLVLTLDML